MLTDKDDPHQTWEEGRIDSGKADTAEPTGDDNLVDGKRKKKRQRKDKTSPGDDEESGKRKKKHRKEKHKEKKSKTHGRSAN